MVNEDARTAPSSPTFKGYSVDPMAMASSPARHTLAAIRLGWRALRTTPLIALSTAFLEQGRKVLA